MCALLSVQEYDVYFNKLLFTINDRSHSRNASPQRGLSPRNRSPLAGSMNAVWSNTEENGSGDGTVSGARYHTGYWSPSAIGAGHSQRSPWSTCGSSSVADGLEDLGDEFSNLAALNKQDLLEDTYVEEGETEKLRVCLLGHIGVGKTSLVSQFMTSDFMNTYDASLGIH